VQTADRGEFEQRAKVLFAGFNVPASPERVEAYWNGLQRMSLPDFAKSVQHALGENGPEKIPTVNGLWGIRKRLQGSPTGEPVSDNRPAIMAQASRLPLSDWQRAAPWGWIVRWFPGVNVAKDPVERHGAEYLGAVVPQDPKDPERYPAHRILARDCPPVPREQPMQLRRFEAPDMRA
jgi:hypothetical protein